MKKVWAHIKTYPSDALCVILMVSILPPLLLQSAVAMFDLGHVKTDEHGLFFQYQTLIASITAIIAAYMTLRAAKYAELERIARVQKQAAHEVVNIVVMTKEYINECKRVDDFDWEDICALAFSLDTDFLTPETVSYFEGSMDMLHLSGARTKIKSAVALGKIALNSPQGFGNKYLQAILALGSLCAACDFLIKVYPNLESSNPNPVYYEVFSEEFVSRYLQ